MIISSPACQLKRGRYFAAMLLACYLFVVSCGQTGALYLPESQTQASTAATAEPVTNDDDEVEVETRKRHSESAENPAADALP
ncbi:MAG: lipoprotein [Pseudomonadales bacterium]